MKKVNCRYSKQVVIGLLFILLLIILSGCTGNLEETQESALDDSPVLVQEISASGEAVPMKWATLSFSSIAKDIEILVSEGDQVTKGTSLARNNDMRLEAALNQAQAAYERAKYAYDQILNAPSDAALKSAYATFINAQITLEQQEDAGASQDRIDIAQANFDSAQANYDAVVAGSSDEEIAAAEYELQAAELALDEASAAFDLAAPFDGTVVEIYIHSGEGMGAFQPILVLADLSHLQVVTTDLSEVDVADLAVGQQAEIIFDAISDQTFTGRIEEIANKSTGVSSVYYDVTLSLDEIPEGLRWGMTAFITFPLE
jgi:multidrug resistance efflux pump